jgi:tRNA threonylcarbamoyladenosine biosynthesis protein TsaB
LVDDDEVETIYQIGDNNHSVTLMPMLEAILIKHNVRLKDINEVIVGIGPGSYTGVRIGVTVAKMIAYLNHIDLYTVSSLALLASSSNHRQVLPLIDARRGNAFMALYINDHSLTHLKEDCLMNQALFKEAIEGDYELVTEGRPNISKILNSTLVAKVTNPHELIPNYLQITEAERNLNND